MYKDYLKRFFDFVVSFFLLLILFPLFLLLTIVGVVFMRGNPFFVQRRIGKGEHVFKLIKFRSMDNRKDENGNLLSEEIRLNKYGSFLRKTSLDEIPELFNIFIGDMSLIGPRPLLPEYLPYYTLEERHRHDVRPGLSGLAQVNGRSFLSWEKIFKYDIDYVNNVTFLNDCNIIIKTIRVVLLRKDITDFSKTNESKDGQLSCVEGGKERLMHQPLNIERMKKCAL